jgi:tRNA-dihydrouridine synthase
VGNGDVMTRQQGLELAKQYKLDGIMIGRGIFHDPFVFAETTPWPDYTPKQRIDLYRQQVKLFEETWQNRERPVHTLNRFCKIYIQHFANAKELREHLMSAKSTTELLAMLDEISE